MRRAPRVLFGGSGASSSVGDLGLLLFRAFAGLALAFGHGIRKLPPSQDFVAGVAEMGFPVPILFGWAAALAEFGGGLLIAVGLLTRPAAALVVITMAVAAFIRQAGDSFGERELAFLFGAAALLLVLIGAGRFSVDAHVRRGLTRPDLRIAVTRPGEWREPVS